MPRAIELYEKSLSIARERGDREGEACALSNRGFSYYVLGEFSRALDLSEQALKIFQKIHHLPGQKSALGNLSLICKELGERERAISYIEATIKIAKEIEDPDLEKLRAQLAKLRGT